MERVRSNTDELEAFRVRLGGESMLSLLGVHGGRVLVDAAVGVGKSFSVDSTTEQAVRSGKYDLVIVLCPTHRVLKERRWVKNPPSDVDVRVLRPRPKSRCGALDKSWKEYEQKGMGLVGKVELCGMCPLRQRCFWPKQYGSALKGSQVIFGTQAHLERDPTFIRQLIAWTRATRPLVILDENDAVLASYERVIHRRDLQLFHEVLKQIDATGQPWSRRHHDLVHLIDVLQLAQTTDLRGGLWIFPQMPMEWALTIQQRGKRQFGNSFQFLMYELQAFGWSPRESRERLHNDDIRFASSPFIGGEVDLVLYSATCIPEFARFRLGVELAQPFKDVVIEHPETRWYNIASRLGARCYFGANSDQVLDFFAGLVFKRIKEGKRPLLVAKKCFLPLCAAGMERRLRELGLENARVVYKNWEKADLDGPAVVSLISYGIVGVNTFEHFDAAYCLTSFNVNEDVLDRILHDVVGRDFQIPFKIECRGTPPRRTVSVVDPHHRIYDVEDLARMALLHREMDVVLQAVGRVRPFTRPREIITFQCAEHPKATYTLEFTALEQARQYFGIPTRRQRQAAITAERVREATSRGLTQRQAAEELGIGLRTVQMYCGMPQ
jgi:hypothetical protein